MVQQRLSKAERRAWWASQTPEQQAEYIAGKMAEQRVKREAKVLDAEFQATVSDS